MRITLLSIFALAVLTLGPGARADTAVDLELVLAVDVSSSVDAYEARLQRQGYLAALRDPAVAAAIASGPLGRIAVTYLEFAGRGHQRVVVDWTVLATPDDARAFADALAARPIGSAPATAISAAIDAGVARIEGNAFSGTRRVIDVSGDGPNSDGRPVWAARDDAVARGITINGLPIASTRPNPDGTGPAAWVDLHYARFVVGGPGAFVLEARSFESFAETLLRKLLKEIRGGRGLVDGGGPVTTAGPAFPPARRTPGGYGGWCAPRGG